VPSDRLLETQLLQCLLACEVLLLFQSCYSSRHVVTPQHHKQFKPHVLLQLTLLLQQISYLICGSSFSISCISDVYTCC
jgi:hypothetical protein